MVAGQVRNRSEGLRYSCVDFYRNWEVWHFTVNLRRNFKIKCSNL